MDVQFSATFRFKEWMYFRDLSSPPDPAPQAWDESPPKPGSTPPQTNPKNFVMLEVYKMTQVREEKMGKKLIFHCDFSI